jgi:hypothetical protein
MGSLEGSSQLSDFMGDIFASPETAKQFQHKSLLEIQKVVRGPMGKSFLPCADRLREISAEAYEILEQLLIVDPPEERLGFDSEGKKVNWEKILEMVEKLEEVQEMKEEEKLAK